MKLVIGIDGGGSTVRVAVTSSDLTVLASAQGGSANPNSAGREAAAQAVQDTIRAALAAASLAPDAIAAVGVGIAGTVTARDWARETVAAVLPNALIRIASDFEIALVGAHGERRGVLILSGTGSVAYGINAAGESAQVGGWGYLLGDEGSGYLLGLKALQAVVRAADGRGQPTALTESILGALHLADPRDLIQWIYSPESSFSRTRGIAQLAPAVLTTHDPVAQALIAESVSELALMAQTVVHRLRIGSPTFAFAGGLLSEPNSLSAGLCVALALPSLPVPKYPPVIGAALLAALALPGH
ncbi:MAG: BadF/BadG/BcrA/BcrD ATPase family protein [Chloroflexota bacterium]